jgi:arabinofuranosyltransferase
VTFPYLALGAMGAAALSYALARFTRQYAVVAVLGATAILLFHGIFYFHYTADDAYITYRYASNFAHGHGLVWNLGQWVEGYTDFIWVLAIAGAMKAGADPVLAGRWLGFGLSVVVAGGVYLLSTRLLDGVAGRAAGLVAALLLSTCGTWAVWATAGLEAPLFAALALASVLLHIREQRRPRIPASGAVWALVAMTRPDGLLLVAVSGAFKLGEATARTLRPGRPRWRALIVEPVSLAIWGVGFVALFVPYFAWRYDRYGWLFPNTYYAKVGASFDQYTRGLDYLAAFSQEYAGWLLLLVPLAIALTAIRRAPALYVLALVAAWMGYVVYVGGDSLARFRFLAPILPLAYPLVAASGAALIAPLTLDRKRWMVEASASLAVASLLAFNLHASAADFALPKERLAVTQRVEMGRWLHDNVPQSTTIAVIPAGAIPYESGLRTIDMLGLSDEHIAHRDLPLGEFPAGHEKYDSQYVLDQRPDIILLTDALQTVAWSESDYLTLDAGVIPARIDMLKQQRLWDEYAARSVRLPGGLWFNLLVRRDAEDVIAKTLPPSG